MVRTIYPCMCTSTYCSSTTGGSDFSPPKLSLTFPRSSTPQTRCGYFSITQDGLDEEVEYFNLTLTVDHKHFDESPILVSINACRADGKVSENILSGMFYTYCDFCIGIRLQQTPLSKGGFSTVEYCYDNHWITLCDSNWTVEDARVTCRQAGYSEKGSFIIFVV